MLSTCSVLGLVLNPSHAFFHLILMPCWHCAHFTGVEAEARKGQRTYPASHASLESSSTGSATNHDPSHLQSPFPSGAFCPELCSEWALKTYSWVPENRCSVVARGDGNLRHGWPQNPYVHSYLTFSSQTENALLFLFDYKSICALLKHAGDIKV